MRTWVALTSIFAVCLLGPAAGAPAALERPFAVSAPFRSLWKAGAPFEIPVAAQVASVRVEVPALPRASGLVLRFRARLHTPAPGGWNNFLGLRWKGQPVRDATPEGKPRLLNRRRAFHSTIPSEAVVPTCQERAGLACLCAFFGPDFDTLDERVVSEREEGYWYLLDLTGLDTSAAGALEFVNTALAEYWGGKPPATLRMVVDDIEVGTMPLEAMEALRAAELVRRAPVKGPTFSVAGAEVTLAPGGGIQFRRGKGHTWFESRYLGPGADAAGPAVPAGAGAQKTDASQASTVGPDGRTEAPRPAAGRKPPRESAAGWLAAVPAAPAKSAWRRAGKGWMFEYAGRGFRLQREVRAEGHRLAVLDTLSNQTQRALGIRIRQRLVTPSWLQEFRFAGVPGQRSGRPFGWGDNPTLYAAQKAGGLGLLAEDDFFRLHMGGDAEANTLSATDDHFALAPGERYTLRFSLYPTGGDFWEFINAARRDWKVNFPVQGPFEFVGAGGYQKPEDAARLRELLASKEIRIFALSPWFEYYSGYGITREAYETMMRNAMRVIRSVKPDAICIPLIETNLVPVPLSFFQGRLPDNFGWGREAGGVYGKEAPAEAAAVLDATPWKDSVVRGPGGRPALDTWYVQYYKEPKGLDLIVYPTLTNHRHRHMLEQMAWLLDDVGFDGVYIDQFAMALGGTDSLTYDTWDGHTVDLDPATGEVTRKYAVVGKISAPARREWVEFVHKRGKLVVANGEPVTGDLQALPVNRFMETQGYDVLSPDAPNATMCARGMLGSPIGLGHSFGQLANANPGRAGELLMRTVIAHLRYGLLYYYYGASVPATDGGFGPVNHMFPFTPVELHEGYVIGKERILTCRSRTFTWSRPQPPRVRLFDKRGMEKPAGAKVEKTAGGYRVSVTLDDWAEVAVIE